jgi:hypothetical protein
MSNNQPVVLKLACVIVQKYDIIIDNDPKCKPGSSQNLPQTQSTTSKQTVSAV